MDVLLNYKKLINPISSINLVYWLCNCLKLWENYVFFFNNFKIVIIVYICIIVHDTCVVCYGFIVMHQLAG